jgi:hypothetical protein
LEALGAASHNNDSGAILDPALEQVNGAKQFV